MTIGMRRDLWDEEDHGDLLEISIFVSVKSDIYVPNDPLT